MSHDQTTPETLAAPPLAPPDRHAPLARGIVIQQPDELLSRCMLILMSAVLVAGVILGIAVTK